jgi:hypothetical protein
MPRISSILVRRAAVLLAACAGLAGPPALASADGLASNLLFPLDGTAIQRAQAIATEYWGTKPCGGAVTMEWGALDGTVNALSTWWNPTSAYGNAGENSQCKVTLNVAQLFDWPELCTVIVHEYGHLAGQQHSTDRNSPMYAYYTHPIAQCAEPPSAAPAPQAPAAAVPSATPSTRAASVKHKHKRKRARRAVRRRHARAHRATAGAFHLTV